MRRRAISDVVIAAAVRTPIGKRNGSLANIHAVDLSALVLNELVRRTGVDPGEIDDVFWGCVTQIGDQSSNIARFAVLAAGWPEHVPGVTINRACGSSQQALDNAIDAVAAGRNELVVAGGVEVMSATGLGAARETGFPYGPRATARYPGFSFNQGLSAELVAQRWNLSRTELDEYASRSHHRADEATRLGRFDEQLLAVPTERGRLSQDEGIRPTTNPEVLAGLAPSFIPDGVIHPGNSSQISDGAAALLVTTAQWCRDHGVRPLARQVGGVAVGADPVEMLTGPIPATQKVLKRTGLSLDEIGAYEINEAFASVPLAWQHSLGADPARLKPRGGAIAVGHPLGASGAILTTRLLHHLRDRRLRYGLQAMCEGGGTANAAIFESLA